MGAHRSDLVGAGNLVPLMVVELAGMIIADELSHEPTWESDAILKACEPQVDRRELDIIGRCMPGADDQRQSNNGSKNLSRDCSAPFFSVNRPFGFIDGCFPNSVFYDILHRLPNCRTIAAKAASL